MATGYELLVGRIDRSADRILNALAYRLPRAPLRNSEKRLAIVANIRKLSLPAYDGSHVWMGHIRDIFSRRRPY